MPSHWGVGDAASSTASGGAALLAIAPFTGPAAPFVAAAGAVTGFISSFLRPNLTKEEASAIVNEVDFDHMRPNLEAWNSLPGYMRNSYVKAAALNVFDQWWQVVVRACQNTQLGAAGVNCIQDRMRGGKLDWFKLFRDPIANDPNTAAANEWAQQNPDVDTTGGASAQPVVDAGGNQGSTPSGGTQTGSSVTGSTGSSKTMLWFGLGLIAVGLVFALGGDES